VPTKIFVVVTIALVVLTAVLTARIVGSGERRDDGHDLRIRVRIQCDTWLRELEAAAEAYDASVRGSAADLPFGSTRQERFLVISRVVAEQKFCRSLRKREGTDLGGTDVEKAGATFFTSDDPSKIAPALRILADAAKLDATLPIGP
jgi:hypothetical protein